MRLERRDAGELRAPERTPEGFLRVEGAIARTGILEYLDANGKLRHELVDDSTLFDPASIRSFAGLALTNTHPSQLLTPDTVAAHQIGTVGDPRRDGDLLISTLGVLARDAIASVEAGRAELSCGYTAEVIEEAGTHPTLRCPLCGTSNHDAIQKDRRGNHVALVDQARAGNSARIRLDSAGNVVPTYCTSQKTPTETPTMPQVIRLDDGRTFTVDDANAPALQSAVRELAARADAADKTAAAEKKAHGDAIAKSTARTDSLIKHINAKGTALKARLDAMKARMIGCDECSGSGKVMDDADKEGACEYCGGSGKVRMHDAIKTLPADGEAANLDDDLAELDDAAAELAEMDDPESAEEQEVATAANSERKDAAKKQRAAARRDSRVKLAASFARRIDRRAAQRAMLLSVASKHVDAADLAGKSDVDIKRAVLTKIAPHLDTVNLDASAVPVLYAAELARAAKQDGAPAIVNQSDALRAGMSQGGPAGARQDANPSAAEIAKKRDDGMANAWRTPAAK